MESWQRKKRTDPCGTPTWYNGTYMEIGLLHNLGIFNIFEYFYFTNTFMGVFEYIQYLYVII